MGKVLKDAFLDELKDAYDGEKQLIRALPKLAQAATNPDLQLAFQSHLGETRNHVALLEQVFELLGEKAKGKHCDGLAGIIEEGKSILEEDFEPATMDACLIAAGHRCEHYEIAAYGTLVAWGEGLGNQQVTKILSEILAEEKMADQKLSQLAEGGIHSEASSEQVADKSARLAGSVAAADAKESTSSMKA